MEQQRQLWNEFMDQGPDYIANPLVLGAQERSILYYKQGGDMQGGEIIVPLRAKGGPVKGTPQKEPTFGELIQIIKGKIHDLNQQNAPDWTIDVPLNPDLTQLSPEGMTELELLSLPPDRHTPQYYAELLARFQNDGQKSRAILLNMQKERIRNAAFLSSLFQYMTSYKRSLSQVKDNEEIPKIPGYADYMASVNSGDFSAYILGKVMGFSPDKSLLEKHIRAKALQGDPLSQKQHADLLMDQLEQTYTQGDTFYNWNKAYTLPLVLEKGLNMFPTKQASSWKEKILKKFPKKALLNKLSEKKAFDEVLQWYRQSADQGNTDAMYAWLTCSFNNIPRYFSRSDWERVQDYNNILLSRGDWRACLHLVSPRRTTLHYIPFLLYSHKSLNSLVRKVDKSGRGDGSFSYINNEFSRHPQELIGVAGGNRPGTIKKTVQWKQLDAPPEADLSHNLKRLGNISPYSCMFKFIYRNYIEKTPPESIQIIKNVVEEYTQKGDPVALYFQGWLYQEGLGYDKDRSRALELWEKAFLSFEQCGGSDVSLAPDKGTVPLVYALPRKIIEYNLNPDFFQKNSARAFEVATLMQDCSLSKMGKKPASLNRYEPSFCYYLGKMYEQGEGTAKDTDKAFACYKKGHDQGNPYCTFELGRCYEQGWGTRMDKTKAEALYDEAAFKSGNPELHQAINTQKAALKKERS